MFCSDGNTDAKYHMSWQEELITSIANWTAISLIGRLFCPARRDLLRVMERQKGEI